MPFCSTKLDPRRLRLGRAVARDVKMRVEKTETFMGCNYKNVKMSFID